MSRAEDALELLMPGADAHSIRRARDVTHFLRLLSDDARSKRAASVGIDLDRARLELERQDRRGLERAVCDLLRHHLDAAAAGATFVSWGEASLTLASAWRVVEEFRDELSWLAAVPTPGEAALAVAERLIESLERLAAPADEIALWRARLVRLSAGSRKAEVAFRAELERVLRLRPPAPVKPQSVRLRLAQVVECLLDRGAVREARSLLFEHLQLVAGDERLRQLLAWTKLCLGESTQARSLLLGAQPPGSILPDALVELRERRPEWLACLAGRRHEGADHTAGFDADPVRSRADIGAVVLVLFALEPQGSARAVRVDVVPGWRDRVGGWLRDREDAVTRGAEAEHRMFVSGRAELLHREPTRAIGAALGGEATLSLALVPWTDGRGEVGGWMHVECEHHLLPARARLERAAAALARGLAQSVPPEGPPPALAALTAGDEPAELDAREPAAMLFREAIRDLGIKMNQRRWSGFLVDGARIELAATGGEGVGLRGAIAGERRALRRAIAARGTVTFDEPDRSLSIDGDAGSGVVLAISAAERCCALLAIESSRRRDFRETELVRYRLACDRIALALRLAQFRRWHRGRFGFDVWFDAVRADMRRFAEDLLAAARTDAPVVLTGPSGAGKQILARWLHFESGARSSALDVVGCDAPASPGGRFTGRWSPTSGASVLFDDVECLDRGAQEELVREIENRDRLLQGARGTRWWLTTRIGLEAAVAGGRIRADLAARLDRVQLRVPGLEDRREDIVPLVECLAERFAGELGRRVPAFADEALGLLWRQPWPGNVRELESFVYKLVLLATGRRVEPDAVLAIARRFGLEPLRRLPSRHPRRPDLLAALRTTRKPGGRVNKTRAAAYLGWDPDTLVTRMTEAGIDEENVGEADTWYAVRAETKAAVD